MVRWVSAMLEVREALYTGIVIIRRRVLHRQVAEALIEMIRPEPDDIAYHFQQAGDSRAIDWLIRAGKRAERAYAMPIAVDRYVAGLDLLEELEERVNDRGRLLYHFETMLLWYDPAQGLVYLQEAHDIGEKVGEQVLAASALFAHGNLLCQLGQIRAGLAEMERGLTSLKNRSHEDCPSLQTTELLPIPDGIAGKQAIRTMQLGSAGYIAEARASAEEYARQSTTAGSDDIDYDRIGDMFLTLARIHALLGNVHEAVAAFEHPGMPIVMRFLRQVEIR